MATSKSVQIPTVNMPKNKAPEEPIAPFFSPLFYNQYTGLHYRSVPLPSCEGEVSWRSDVKREGCQNQRNILAALFQYVPQKNTGSIYYVFWDFIIFHEAFFLAEANIYFPPGGWLNRVTNEFGFDMISLCVAVQGIPYYTALDRLAKFVRITPNGIDTKPKGEHSRYVHEKNPLTVLYLPGPAFPDYPRQFDARYFSSSGQIIAIVEYYDTYSGKPIKIYHTLWRHHQSQILHWRDSFPDPPYPLFNSHMLAQHYAQAKVGKTWFALSLAYVIAKGDCQFARWRSLKKSKKVLYIDGEMLPDELGKNIRMIMAGFGDSVMEKVFTEDTFRFEMVTQTGNTKRIVPDKIKKLAKIKFLKEVEKMSYTEIERVTGIKRSTAQELYKDKMPDLTSNERAMLDQEFERLVDENSLNSQDWENSEL